MPYKMGPNNEENPKGDGTTARRLRTFLGFPVS